MEPLGNRDALIRRLAGALHGHDDPRRLPTPAPPRETVPPSVESRIARFSEALRAAAGSVVTGSSRAVPATLAEALRAAGVVALLVPDGDAPARELADALLPMGPFHLASPAGLLHGQAPATAGIQSAEFAVAETGTIVQTGRGGRSLLPGLVTALHVALVAPGILVDRMEDVLAALAADPPRAIAFITGPSRTGDIEQTLTLGAHGPRQMIAVIAE
ncbi:MAG TPA: LUD domain-containing protein [Candidatus Deferrimicrobiaceae bacterium]